MSRRLISIAAVICLLALSVSLSAAQTTERPLAHKDYDAWRTINEGRLSRDGKYFAYSFMPQEGDGDVIVRELATGREMKFNVGALPPPPVTPPSEVAPEAEPPRRSVTLRFTSDGRYLVANTFPLKVDTDKAKKEKKKPEEMPKGGLLIVSLAAGTENRISEVKSFQVPEKGGAWVAYLKEGKPEPKPAETAKPAEIAKPPAQDAEDQRPGGPRGGAAGGAAGGARREYGTDLVLRRLEQGDAGERTFAGVIEYSFARDGQALVYAVSSRKEEENGVYSVILGNEAPAAALLSGKGRYAKLTWDREQTQMAFISSKDDPDPKLPKFKVYGWDRKATPAAELVASGTPGFPAKYVVSDKGNLAFSRDGRKLYVPAGPPAKPEKEGEATDAADEKVTMDLWHWKDEFVQSMQKARANQDRNRTYRGVFHLTEKRYVQLADESLATINPNDAGTLAIGNDDRPYRRMVDYDGSYSDVYLVDTSSGSRKLLLRQFRGGGGMGFGGGLQWSLDGKWATYFDKLHWHLVSLPEGSSRNVTETLAVAFHNEEDDTPDPPGPYGSGGWMKDSKSFLLYDRFDVWQVFVDGSSARNLTGGVGRRDNIQFRVQQVEPPDEDEGDRGIDPAKPLYLRAVSQETRDSGFYRVALSGGAPQRLLWGSKSYSFREKAREADVVLITAQRFDEYPDWHVTNTSFGAPRKVTNGGAQKDPFLWGAAELISYRNIDGVPLKGILIKPGGFEPAKKYPMMVYIYEKLSQGLHSFVNPQPGTSIDASFYASNGYLVLMPDIVYTTGYPGQSALKCVLPAIDAAVARGFVDENAIGIQGHSWGGYQIAYMVTQTTRFKAAEAGAPVGNMTSAYSGIRWGSGQPRQFQYEQTQSRIGEPLYANPQRFMENSAVFYAGRVKTPLLILHNDQDDAVPWYQGIELFLALRRNDKEAFLCVYNGEYHGLRRRHNQMDWTIRMQQFFDHYLKGAPKPEWMEKGVPYLEREEEKERLQKGRVATSPN